jgi:glycosyltransferase involved in cell wall biosynthesis
VIVYLHQAAAYGAVERYLEDLLRGLEEPAVLIAPRGEELAPLAGLAELRPFDLGASAPRTFVQLARELRRLRPRLVHVVDVWPLAFLAARAAGVPRIVVTHHTPELPRQDNLPGRLLWRAGWATHPEVIYTSDADRRRDGRQPSVVIPLGIDLDAFDVERQPGPTVGTVARLVPQKGIDTLVAAVPLVLRERPDAHFVVIGDGPLRDELERQAQGLPVEFRGEVSDVPSELARLGVFALPSRFEGLCLAVIEAQAAGVPVVATPVGGIAETVVDGETGLLVPVDDPAALAAAILRLLGDPELGGRLAAEAKSRAARFSREAMVHQTLTFYEL